MINLNIKKESGRSMIEMLGVLAIIGVLSVGGIAGYSKAMMKYKINKTIEQITLIAGNVRTFFGSQRNYEGLTCAYLNECDTAGCTVVQKAKLVPDEMIEYYTSGTHAGKIKMINNEFGGYLSLQEADSQSFVIKIGSVPQEACVELLSQDWSSAGIRVIYLGLMDAYYMRSTPNEDLQDVVEICEFYKTMDSNEAIAFVVGKWDLIEEHIGDDSYTP